MTVIVEGEKFLHHSLDLCKYSEYFDAMLSSNMKEAQTKVIEFPNKKVEEWREVSKFIDDPVLAELREDNIEMLVRWFSELRMMDWLTRSDCFYKSILLKRKARLMARGVKIVKLALRDIKICVEYGFSTSTEEGLSFLENVMKDYAHFLNLESIETVVSVVNAEAARSRLWPAIKKMLPSCSQEMGPSTPLSNELLAGILNLKADLSYSEVMYKLNDRRGSLFESRSSKISNSN